MSALTQNIMNYVQTSTQLKKMLIFSYKQQS